MKKWVLHPQGCLLRQIFHAVGLKLERGRERGKEEKREKRREKERKKKREQNKYSLTPTLLTNVTLVYTILCQVICMYTDAINNKRSKFFENQFRGWQGM